MADFDLRVPGFYDRELDLTNRSNPPSGIPATVIGASNKGPAFVPVTVGSYFDFSTAFGDVDQKFYGGYAVQKFLENRQSLTFVRVLGAGANSSTEDFDNTRTKGIVKNAGMKVSGSTVSQTGDGRHQGFPQFLAARHSITGSEAYAMPMFTDNGSFNLAGNAAYLLRGVIFTSADARVQIFHPSESYSRLLDDTTSIDNSASTSVTYQKFKIAISSSAGSTFASDDGFSGVKIFTASLNPSDNSYVGKILNTNPEKFDTEKHVFYGDFSVDNEIASVKTGEEAVGIVSGSANVSTTSGDSTLKFLEAFGRFDTRYTTPKTTWFISQPYGTTEYNLFQIESFDDGDYAGSKFKISITNVKASSDPKYRYGTFTVQVRNIDDTDFDPQIIEQFNNLTLDPNSDNYIAKVIGDKKYLYLFDVLSEDDRKISIEGKYGLASKYIRVIVSEQVENKIIPDTALPFGFRGISTLATSPLLKDFGTLTSTNTKLGMSGTLGGFSLTGSIVPPLPLRFKVTRGDITASANYTGQPGPTETTDSRLYWGIKFERNTNVTNPNVVSDRNAIVDSYSKFMGIEKLDVLVTGSFSDSYNENKFTLARVALPDSALANITASTAEHMRGAAYIRNGVPDGTNYYISDGAFGNRVTLATLLMKASASLYNLFSEYSKFTTVMCGGWNGVNIFDKNAIRFSDKATSIESGGAASTGYVSPGATGSTNWSGTVFANNAVSSYKTAIDIATDTVLAETNLLVIPGQREPIVTDYAADKNSQYGKSFYIMDIPNYDSNITRIFDGDTGVIVSPEKTAEQFDTRAIDNTSVAAYFPNFIMEDTVNKRRLMIPASVAALSAFGFNDRVSYAWFAPAGFNRASLDFVISPQVKYKSKTLATLLDARINAMNKYPQEGYVFLSQRTLKFGASALESINVKRMILSIKKDIIDVANNLLWDQIVNSLREKFIRDATQILSSVQLKKGIENFRVICDRTNNTDQDVLNNKINASIRILPVRALEYITLEYIVTSGQTIVNEF